MTARGRGLWGLAKLTLLALVIAAGAVGLTREHRPAHASHTKIFVSKSINCATSDELFSYVSFLGGPEENLYLCARDVDNTPWGAAGFNIDFRYISWLINVNAVLIDDPAYASGWLDDTGRAVQCLPLISIEPNIATGQGHVVGSCYTPGAVPPYGPLSNHVLARITIQPGIVKASTSIDFRPLPGQLPTTGTVLVSAYLDPQFPQPVIIPASVPLLPVNVAPCADYHPVATGGNNFVNIFDILFLAGKFGQSSSSPGWSPDWDMDGNNFVNVFDILIAGRQFGRTCPA